METINIKKWTGHLDGHYNCDIFELTNRDRICIDFDKSNGDTVQGWFVDTCGNNIDANIWRIRPVLNDTGDHELRAFELLDIINHK